MRRCALVNDTSGVLTVGVVACVSLVGAQLCGVCCSVYAFMYTFV